MAGGVQFRSPGDPKEDDLGVVRSVSEVVFVTSSLGSVVGGVTVVEARTFDLA